MRAFTVGGNDVEPEQLETSGSGNNDLGVHAPGDSDFDVSGCHGEEQNGPFTEAGRNAFEDWMTARAARLAVGEQTVAAPATPAIAGNAGCNGVPDAPPRSARGKQSARARGAASGARSAAVAFHHSRLWIVGLSLGMFGCIWVWR